jgi:hypothetical protein
MTAIRLQSFRSLGDTDFVEVRPLTILVGRNSSGKSSFLRFLPLLRQSVETRTTGPIQWYGDYVDFGGFEETHSTFSANDEMRFGFRTTLGDRPRPSSFVHFDPFEALAFSRQTVCEVTIGIVPDPKDASVTRFKSVRLEAAGHRVDIDLDHTDRPGAVLVNGSEPLGRVNEQLWLRKSHLLPHIGRRESTNGPASSALPFLRSRLLAVPELMDAFRPLCHGNTSDEKIAEAARTIRFGSDEDILDSLRAQGGPGRRWQEAVQRLDVGDPRFRAIRDLVVANHLGSLLSELDTRLGAFARGVRYSKPVRATAERYYRQQDLAVGEIDPEGRNLAVFLRSLSDARRRGFEEWTLEEMGWKIVTSLRGGHISLRLHEEGGGSHNLADVGFGFSQMLPVLAQLWSMQALPGRRSRLLTSDLTFAIEQPELHLHPGLQARLADTMTRAITSARKKQVGLTLVVETHSEAMVNRIGHLIARGQLKSEDAAVVLFEPSHNGKGSTVRTATFDSDGYLQNWPFGFFEPG